MKIEQKICINQDWKIIKNSPDFSADKSNLVFVFGGKNHINDKSISSVKADYKNALVVSCTTAGEVLNDKVYDEQISITAIEFEKTEIKSVDENISDSIDSFDLGSKLMSKLPSKDLAYVMVLSDGALINGTELVLGLRSKNHNNVLITGGLAGDGPRFQSTLVGINYDLKSGNVVLIGFYGQNLKVGHGSMGGWSEFGPERIVTKSVKNVLFELEGKSALSLYKEYLGKYAEELPGSALLFPLSIIEEGAESKNVRTILSIDEKNDTMTFAGNLPEGSKVRLMKANFDKIINASSEAAENAINDFLDKPELAIMISCVGRKLILNERVVEEIENAKEVFGNETFITGFYSYGEISPLMKNTKCELWNQTMTITTLSEF